MINKAVSLRDLLPPPTIDRRMEYEMRKTQHKLKFIEEHQSLGAEEVALLLEDYDRSLVQRQTHGAMIKRLLHRGKHAAHPRVVQGMELLQALLD